MGFIKQASLILLSAVAILTGIFCTTRSVGAISETELSNISQNCASIKQSLTQLQRADSRTRSYLGASYETISSTFIAPLNSRLVKNNIVSSELLEIQANFSDEQAKFRSSYTTYMRELESLLAVDCKTDPQNFYHRLEVVRERRNTLRETTTRLSALVDQQISAVEKLRESLHE